MKTSALLARTALAAVALSSFGTAIAGEGLAKYYSLQNSAKYFSTTSGNTGASLVVIRHKDNAGSTASGSTYSRSSSGGSLVTPTGSTGSTGSSYVSSKADSYESISDSSASKGTVLATYKTNTGTTPSGWSGFTNSGNYSIVTANGGVALNNVYVGGDLNVTLNISGGTWNTSPQGGGNCCCVSHS